MSHLTRRSLIRGAAGLTGVLSLGGLAACSTDGAVSPAAKAVAEAGGSTSTQRPPRSYGHGSRPGR